jgi:DNA-binding response OmpR family regulator
MKLQAGHLKLVDQELYRGENTTPIKLTLKEAHLLAVLMRYPGQVVNRATLMREVWPTNHLGNSRSLDVHICWLRQKIEKDPRIPELILTRRGQGYELRV